MQRIEGGAVLPIVDFWLGRASTGHTSEQEGHPVSQSDLDASNRMSGTAWVVNRDILTTSQQVHDLGHPALGFDPQVPPVIQGKVPHADFMRLPVDDRRRMANDRTATIKEAQAWLSETSATSALLGVAHDDSDLERFYLNVGHDSRLRRYNRLSRGPNPQGSGLSRSLLRFADGVPLGSRGLFWLAVRAATSAGHDKLDHEARAAWTSANTEALRACAREPLLYDFWWKDEHDKPRDDPWALLATAQEIDQALSRSSPGDFLSHLPCHVDGTCNGLQHLSALGLDARGALATNLTSDPSRHDIYAEVAELVDRSVREDAATGLDVASEWLGRVDRNLVKRGTMTTNYGVTKRGMRDQLIDDNLVSRDDHEDVSAAAGYMRDCMWSAIGNVAVSARNIMDWLQTTAGALGSQGHPLRWVTPAGSTIQQAYRPWTAVRPVTAAGQITVAKRVDRSSISVRKGALAAAPNFVHSFDAAHMARTINHGAREGITHWAMIHDSYGTHASRMDTLNRVLREEFVAIYRTDWLASTYDFIKGYAPRVDLQAPPARGEFDIGETLGSLWLFS